MSMSAIWSRNSWLLPRLMLIWETCSLTAGEMAGSAAAPARTGP